jgi:predicted CXXCH cytochrome family protein
MEENRFLAVAALLILSPLVSGASQVCAGCHKEIAATQARTAMARTWQGQAARQLPAHYAETHQEGPPPDIDYSVERTARGLQFQVHLPGQEAFAFPVETTMGGTRHGLSFLFRLHSLNGVNFARAPLIEGRYLHYAPQNKLTLSPGFPEDKPTTLETAFGRVLGPEFEKKCLACHGAESGVTCENCHGPAQAHLSALSKRTADKGILNPAKLPVAEQMRPCSQCHAGFSNVQDPLPEDLLISDQVTALSNSECWRQSAGQITCANCHNPHQDAPRAVVVTRSEKTCLQCHSESVRGHAGLCPVNRTSGCVGCHMPDETRAPFVIADHWIRVHPEQNAKAQFKPVRSEVVPRRLFLRMMVMDDRAKAASIREQLLAGGSFFALARANSIDRNSGMNGGFLGDLSADQLDPAWKDAALKLEPGEVSNVIEASGRFYILQRMPRNFREQAGEHYAKAMELRKQGKAQESAAELLEALKIYPQFLRALTYLGVTYAEAGNPQAGAGILSVAIRLYPNDAGAHFNLGIAEGAMGKEDEIAEYKRTVEIDPDFVLAYLNWGSALYAKGQYAEAIQVYRKGIEVNPVLASLHYSLGLALQQVNEPKEAQTELGLARKIDPKVGGHQ